MAIEPTDLLALGQEAFGQLTRHCNLVKMAFEKGWKERSAAAAEELMAKAKALGSVADVVRDSMHDG